jgi:hypothetical protein
VLPTTRVSAVTSFVMTDSVEALARIVSQQDRVLPCSDSDATSLVDAADEHGVTLLLWERLSRSGEPGAVRAALDARARGAATRDLLVRGEMEHVLDAIAAAGGQVIVFKGSALAYTVYPQPWHRPRTDTDLLTAPGDVPVVSAAIESCGYTRSNALTSGRLVSHQVAFERVDAHGLHHVVDLHWKVVNPQVLADVVDFEEVWRDAGTAPALGASARVPSPVTSAVLACVHRLAHHQGHDRLIWLYDLKLLSERFSAAEWERLCDVAAAKRVSAICLDGFSQAHRLLGAPLPSRVATRLAEAGTDDPSRRYVDTTVHRRDVLVSDLARLPGWGARLRLVREHAFPPPAFILQRYGLHSAMWLPALYAHRLVTGAWKWVRP